MFVLASFSSIGSSIKINANTHLATSAERLYRIGCDWSIKLLGFLHPSDKPGTWAA
jgi:hypothetical protein